MGQPQVNSSNLAKNFKGRDQQIWCGLITEVVPEDVIDRTDILMNQIGQ